VIPPRKIDALNDIVVKNLSCGLAHTLLVSEPDGEVFAWGCAVDGRLGIGPVTEQKVPVPVKLDINNIRTVACGSAHSLFLSEFEEVFSCGSNAFGALGYYLTGSDYQDSPKRIEKLNKSIKQIACGLNHSMALTVYREKGMVFTFGRGREGQLGIGRCEDITLPRTVNFGSTRFLFIAAGPTHSIAVASNMMFTWGSRAKYQLGKFTQKSCTYPEKAKFFGMKHISRISCGWNFNLLFTEPHKPHEIERKFKKKTESTNHSPIKPDPSNTNHINVSSVSTPAVMFIIDSDEETSTFNKPSSKGEYIITLNNSDDEN